MRRSPSAALVRRDAQEAWRPWALAASTLLVLSAAALTALPARAALSALNESELSDMRGQAAALIARGLPPMASPFYDGGSVAQVAIDTPPTDFSFDAAALIPGVGGQYHGPSFGTINISGLDARGTVLWIWKH